MANITDKFIAIIQTGQPIQSALNKYGDFDAWFIKNMQIDVSSTRTYPVYKTLKFPSLDNVAGVIITGSPSMVTDEEKWSEKTIEWLKQFIHLEIPVLGVCYGHQQLAKMLGGTVGWNPNGRQIGQVEMHLTQSAKGDALLKTFAEKDCKTTQFIATHQQSVTSLPADVTLLGSTNLDPYHCFRYKDHIWGLQFHPEFTSEIIKDYIDFRADDIQKEGLNPSEILNTFETANNKDNGIQLLTRFKDICFNRIQT